MKGRRRKVKVANSEQMKGSKPKRLKNEVHQNIPRRRGRPPKNTCRENQTSMEDTQGDKSGEQTRCQEGDKIDEITERPDQDKDDGLTRRSQSDLSLSRYNLETEDCALIVKV